MKNNDKKKAPPPPRICYICGKEIEGEEPEYIKTRRGTKIYLHRRCIERRIAFHGRIQNN